MRCALPLRPYPYRPKQLTDACESVDGSRQASLSKKTTVEAEDNSSAPESELRTDGFRNVLENTLRKAQDILWEALSPGTSRGATIVKLKELLWSPEISTALAASSDNYLAFAAAAASRLKKDDDVWLTDTDAILTAPDLK